ncbi:MAG: polyprenol monophosphomannose synthase [Methanophagales archaeon]|nr:polyprenol monophosphomannose synthase [Methanophagales archaeon]
MKLAPAEVVVVIPTYNEKRNIKILVPQVLKVLEQRALEQRALEQRALGQSEQSEQSGLSGGGKIVVVDDNSPDGTAEAVKEWTRRCENVFLLSRKEKGGLGSAYVVGFKFAIERLRAGVVFEMDGDCSHDPKDIPRFLDEFKSGRNGYDVVVGSRYIRGGAIPKWGLYRRLVSRGGNFFARTVAGIPVHDCTSGYRAIRTAKLKEVELDALNVQGYAFQICLLHALIEKGAKVKEIPIVFSERRSGESKLGNGDIKEFFFNSFRLRLKKHSKKV